MKILNRCVIILSVAAMLGLSNAQEGGMTAATAIAAEELVIKAIGGLVSWIGDENESAAASAYKSVSAKHDNTPSEVAAQSANAAATGNESDGAM